MPVPTIDEDTSMDLDETSLNTSTEEAPAAVPVETGRWTGKVNTNNWLDVLAFGVNDVCSQRALVDAKTKFFFSFCFFFGGSLSGLRSPKSLNGLTSPTLHYPSPSSSACSVSSWTLPSMLTPFSMLFFLFCFLRYQVFL